MKYYTWSPIRTLTASNMSMVTPNPSVANLPWISVKDRLPPDNLTVLAWDAPSNGATLAHHDAALKEQRGDAGWIMAGNSTSHRVLTAVSHWCDRIPPPELEERAVGMPKELGAPYGKTDT
jgi:hypothetical protein